ncbi:GIY-YIG nuclease family protein [Pseudoalteromonas rubra]|uniref:GIY-YIG nuclease family protein n=1 Tax=Pseudoalteromonas rubra TaxID=43658 RepID=UPI0023E7F1A4|nr:GIY-YIG nuclease family protein [Pseudoalteromonas rubra]
MIKVGLNLIGLRNLKIIRKLEDARIYKRGWTYVLLSNNKRIMKIGKATTDLSKRVYQHQHCREYKSYDFQFLLAIDSAKYESLLLEHFDEYRRRYKWLQGEDIGKHFSKKEANTLALRLFKNDKMSYDSIHDAFWKNTRVTRNELFVIPPRKIGEKLEVLIQQIIMNKVLE